MPEPVSSPCALHETRDGVTRHCDGRVVSVKQAYPLDDGSGRVYATAACDTCQALYEFWADEETGEGVSVLITTARARSLPEAERNLTTYDGEGNLLGSHEWDDPEGIS